jgi:3-hydroxyisobutyrate dehydrogenase-like beta-hydroxyacid dehydrogenase
MPRVGLIGIGLVGSAIAERLLEAKYQVAAYDIRQEQREILAQLGGEPLADARAVAECCERVILSLPASDIVRRVMDEVGAALRPGCVVVDTTTGAPEDAKAIAAELSELGVDYVDATIAGSSRQVRTREAIFICGGSDSAYARCGDLLDQCCRQAFHVGPAGSGARMKLVINLVLGLNRAVLAEGLEFARASGIDPYLALEILKASPAYSRAMDTKGLRMLNEEFDPEARLSQHLKDVRLILASGQTSGARLPLSTLHRELLKAAEAAGFGTSDNSAVIKVFQKRSLRAADRDQSIPQESN